MKSFSEPEPLPSGTVLAYARQNKPILLEERLIKATFEDSLAFADVRERDGAHFLSWKLGTNAVELEPTDPRAQALIVKVQACIEKAEHVLVLLRTLLERDHDPVRLAPGEAREFGQRLLLRADYDLTRGVSLNRLNVEHQREVLAKTVQTLRWALRKPRAVADDGTVKLIGWGYCPPSQDSKEHAIAPLRLRHYVEGVGEDARIVFCWDSHPSFTESFVLKEKAPRTVEFQPIAEVPPGSSSVNIPFRADVHAGRYFLTTKSARGLQASNTVEVDARRPNAPRTPEPPPSTPPPPDLPSPSPQPIALEPTPPPTTPPPTTPPLPMPQLEVRAAEQVPRLEVEWRPPAGLDPAGVSTEVEFEEAAETWTPIRGAEGAFGKLVDTASDVGRVRTYRARHVTDAEVSSWATATWTPRTRDGCWPLRYHRVGCAPPGCLGLPNGCFAWLATLPLWLALLLLLLAGAALLGLLFSILSLLGSLFGFWLPGWMTLFGGAPRVGSPHESRVAISSDPDETPPTLGQTLTPRETSTPAATNEEALVTGEVQLILRWNTKDDLDLVGRAPGRQAIWFNQPRVGNGFLDRDDNRSHSNPAPVENIYWTSPCEVGTYEVFVRHWSADPYAGAPGPVPFALTIKSGANVRSIEGAVGPGAVSSVHFTYPRSGEWLSTLGTPEPQSLPISEEPKSNEEPSRAIAVPPVVESAVAGAPPDRRPSPSPQTPRTSIPREPENALDPDLARAQLHESGSAESKEIAPRPKTPDTSPEPRPAINPPDIVVVQAPSTTGMTPRGESSPNLPPPTPETEREGGVAPPAADRAPQSSDNPPSSAAHVELTVSTAAPDIIPRLLELFANARGSRWDFKQDDGGSFFHPASDDGGLAFGVSIWVDFAKHPDIDPQWDRNLDSAKARELGFSRSARDLHTPAAVESYPKARWVNIRIEERPQFFGTLALSDFSGPSNISVERGRRHVTVSGAPAVWWVTYMQGPNDQRAQRLEWWINRRSERHSIDFHWNEHLSTRSSWQLLVPEPQRIEAQLTLKGDGGDEDKTDVAHTGVFWLEILK